MAFTLSLPNRSFPCVLGGSLALLMLACGVESPDAPPEDAFPGEGQEAAHEPAAMARAASGAAPGARHLGRFEGEIDPFGGPSSLRFIPADEKSAALPGVGRSPRTGSQLLLEQNLDELGYTIAECGPGYWDAKWAEEGSAWRFWLDEGAPRTSFFQRLVNGPPDSDGEDALRFCTEFTLRNISSNTYGDLWLMFDGIALERGYAFVDSVPRRLEGLGPDGTDLEYAPVSDRGMFNYGPLAPSQEVARQWYFYRAPGSALQRFRVSGDVVEILHEQCGTGQDNNGDGIVDSGCGTVPDGQPCFLDADCASGACEGSDLTGSGPGEWTVGTCAFGPDGPPNLGAPCSDDTDCGSGERCAPQAQDRACVPDLVLPGGVPLTFQFVPAGSAIAGSPADPPELGRFANEVQSPVVHTNATFVMTTEVTQGQWMALMDANPSCFQDPVQNDCSIDNANPDAPVEEVTLWSALAFANALSVFDGLAPCYVLPDPGDCTGSAGDGDLECPLVFEHPALTVPSIQDCTGYRLPTDAEWEYAARAGTTAATYLGSPTSLDCAEQTFLPTIARTLCDAPPLRPGPVASLLPNDWGLYDMLGNVWEWVWGANNQGVPEGVNPSNEDGPLWIVRGGGINALVTDIRAARRFQWGAAPASQIGFRLVRRGPAANPEIDCGLPDAPDNGVAIPTAGTLLGAAVTSVCDPGYVIEGFATRYCAPDGQWFPEAPQCIPAQLGDPCSSDADCPIGAWCPDESSAGVTIFDPRCAPRPALPGDVQMPFHLVPAAGMQITIGAPDGEFGSNPAMELYQDVAFARSFWMQRTELTQAQWGAIIAAAEDALGGPLGYGMNPAYGLGAALS